MHESVKTGNDVSKDGDLSLHNLVHVPGLNLEVNDASTTRGSSSSCGRGEGVDLTCHTIIKPSTKDSDDIRMLDSQIGVGGAAHAAHMQGSIRGLTEDPQASGCGGDRNAPSF